MMSAPKSRMNVLKIADFRRELSFREKKVAAIKREQMRVHADIRPVPRYMITVDLSHARGNLDALKICLKELEWKEYPFGRKDQHCDIHWHCINFEQNPDVYGGKVNKFPGMSWICSKMNLFRILDQMYSLYPDEYDFFPRTWYLPEQLPQLAHDIRKMNEKKVKPRPTFIVKPDAGSQGEGIYLLRDIQDYIPNTGRIHVCQEYLNDVFLIDKYKFDLRVYAVLKSIDPLEFYICKEGLARFSTVPYENPTNKNLHETYMHLTNYSLNKKSTTFNRSERDDEGSKRTMSSVFNRMKRYGFNMDKVWTRIERIITKTMIAIIPDLKIEMQAALPPNKPGPRCFQILGFDILLLHNLKPMLLEINSSPSLRIDCEVEIAPGVPEYLPSPKDEEVKLPLIRDTLLLAAPRSKIKYLQRWREEHKKMISYELQSERLKRRKVRRERRRQRQEEEERVFHEQEENRLPAQMERDGVIHVETNHPRSSIIIIRASDEDDSIKKTARESSFSLPNVHNAVTNSSESDYFNKADQNQNQSSPASDSKEPLSELTFNQRTEYVDQEDNNNNGGDKIDMDKEIEMKDNKVVEETESYHDDTRSETNSEDDKLEPDVQENCLKQLYPDPYEKKYDCLRMYEKLAEIFMICLGVRATQRLGPTGFRTFARKCRLNKRGLMNAALDILYIDIQRKWEHANPERTTGLCFRGFLDACHEIARRKFTNGDKLQTMEDFIDYCLENLHEEQAWQLKNNSRLLMRRVRPHGYPLLAPMSSPTVHINSLIEDKTGILLESKQNPYLKPTSAEDVDLFLRRHGRLEAIKHKSAKRSKSRLKERDET